MTTFLLRPCRVLKIQFRAQPGGWQCGERIEVYQIQCISPGSGATCDLQLVRRTS
jgi:hypothetical protein